MCSAPISYFEGQFVAETDAKISIRTHAFLYGTSLFEGIRGYYNEDNQITYLFRGKEHYERLLTNAKLLLINPTHTADQMVDISKELVAKNNFGKDLYMQPRLYISSHWMPPSIENQPYDICVFTLPFGNYVATDEGLSVCVSPWRRISDNAIPPRGKISGAYVNSALAMSEAHLNGFADAIFLTEAGDVSEGSGMNVFLVRNGKLITPAVNAGILEGITRSSVIELAQNELGLEVEERTVQRTELYVADEVFFTGTAAQIAPVTKIDHRLVGNGSIGPITQKLQDLYNDVVRGKVAKYHHWLEPVKTVVTA